MFFDRLRAAQGCAAIFDGRKPLKMGAIRKSHFSNGDDEKATDGFFSRLLVFTAKFPLALLNRLFRLCQLDHVLQKLRPVVRRRHIFLIQSQCFDLCVECVPCGGEVAKHPVVTARTSRTQTRHAETIRAIAFHARMFRCELTIAVEIIVDLAFGEAEGLRGRHYLVFVEVGHEISDADGLAVSETQTLVYRNQPDPNAVVVGKPAPEGAEWSRTISPDPVLLFRFSALSFLGHRIHYDRDYTTKVEGYPALLVHGPFTGIMLMDLFRRQSPVAVVKNFTVRAVGPLFDDAPFTLNGRIAGSQVDLWASNRDGELAMSVTAELE